MNLQEFFRSAIQSGINADPRGRTAVEQGPREARAAFEELKPEDKTAFDQEKFLKPYANSRPLHGSPAVEVKTVLAGIDIETPELLLADRLNERGRAVDLVLARHPEGRTYANFHEKHHNHIVIAGHISSGYARPKPAPRCSRQARPDRRGRVLRVQTDQKAELMFPV